jgi:hypothetical protein
MPTIDGYVVCACRKDGIITGLGVVRKDGKSDYVRNKFTLTIDEVILVINALEMHGRCLVTSPPRPQTPGASLVAIEGDIVRTKADGLRDNNLTALPECSDYFLAPER